MRRSLHLFIALFSLLILFTAQYAVGEVNISVPDTVLTRGIVYSIPIKCTITDPNVQSIQIVFSYNAYIIDIKNANGGPNFVMNCQPPDFSNDLTVINTATTTVTCGSIATNPSGTLLSLNIEGLAGPDTICRLYVDKVFLNGSEVQFVSNIGNLIVPGEPIFQTSQQSIGQNYPNPFNYWTKFDFSIADSTKVEFRVYNLDGRQVEFTGNINGMFVINKIANNVSIPVDLHSVLSQGNYTLTFTPDSYQLGSGVYFLTMKTVSGDNSSSFVFVK
jgi:hypothetical protein